MKIRKILIAVVLLGIPAVGFSADLSWYAGVAGGVSSLRPETQNSPFTVDSDISFGAGAFVGYDLSRRFSLELGYNYLGNATLSSDTGKTDIGYSALSAGALMYLFGDARDLADRSGFAGYIRFGASSMNNSATIPLDREDGVAILAGVGVEWPFSHNLSLRGELTSFDGDAQAARASVLYRPRSNSRPGTPVARAPKAPRMQPAPQTPVPNPATPSVNAQPGVSSQPATTNTQNNCVAPVANEPADGRGCAMFTGKLSGVEFNSGTAQPTPGASQLLDRLAQNLLRYPNIVIEIQAHTESFGSEARAKSIARQRTLAVARYLAGRGIPVQRLRARAFGHSQPVAADDSPAGRQQNNRIELRLLQ